MENPSLFLAFLLILERIIIMYLNLAFLASEAGIRILLWSEHHRLKMKMSSLKALERWGIGFYNRSKESIQNKCWETDFLNQVKRVIKNFDIIAVKLFFTIFIPYLRNTVPQIFKMNVTQLKILFSSLGFFNYHRVIQKFLYLWPFVLTRA